LLKGLFFMPLHPQSVALIEQVAMLNAPPTWTLTPAEARVSFARYRALAGDPEAVAHVEDRIIPGPGRDIPIRIYAPKSDAPLPVTAYFHGGGFVIGDLDSHDIVCRALANRTPCIVVSVHYALAPELKFPAAAEDAYAAVCWIGEHAREFGGDPRRLATAGDSAGGNLATVAAMLARDNGGPHLRFQALIYPVTDSTRSLPSYEEFGAGYLLTKETMTWFLRHYVNESDDLRHPHLSPLFAENLAGLPPALVITAEYDPLRDEGARYAERLRDAGVPTQYAQYDGMLHGFFAMPALFDDARRATDEVAAALRDAFQET
jgi:acetyl esterase